MTYFCMPFRLLTRHGDPFPHLILGVWWYSFHKCSLHPWPTIWFYYHIGSFFPLRAILLFRNHPICTMSTIWKKCWMATMITRESYNNQYANSLRTNCNVIMCVVCEGELYCNFSFQAISWIESYTHLLIEWNFPSQIILSRIELLVPTRKFVTRERRSRDVGELVTRNYWVIL